jgi:DNA-binding MarR family transcriptional regulator
MSGAGAGRFACAARVAGPAADGTTRQNGGMTSPEPTGHSEAEPLHYTGFLFRRAQQVHVTAWQRHVSPTVSSVQFGVLAVLARRPEASQQDLCEELDLDRSTIADLVSRLERRGLIERRRDPADRRRNRLVLSAAGQATLDDLRPRAEQVEHVLTDGLSPDDRQVLRRLLLRVLAHAEAERLQVTGASSMASHGTD